MLCAGACVLCAGACVLCAARAPFSHTYRSVCAGAAARHASVDQGSVRLNSSETNQDGEGQFGALESRNLMCSPSRAGLHERGILQAKRQVKRSRDRNGLSGVYGGWSKTEQGLLPSLLRDIMRSLVRSVPPPWSGSTRQVFQSIVQSRASPFYFEIPQPCWR